MRFLLCLVLATGAGMLYFRFLAWNIEQAIKKDSTGARASLAAGFLLRFIGWGILLVALVKWEPYGAIAALLGFFIAWTTMTVRTFLRARKGGKDGAGHASCALRTLRHPDKGHGGDHVDNDASVDSLRLPGL